MTKAPPSSATVSVRVSFAIGFGLCLSACVHEPTFAPLALGPVDSRSSVAAEVRAAEAAPGRYPRLSSLPAMPADIRPAAAWRQAVLAEWAQKTAAEREAAAIPFTLQDSAAWAAQTRARVSPDEAHGASDANNAQAEAFAAAGRARATPPPSPK